MTVHERIAPVIDADSLISEPDVLARWPALSKSRLRIARHTGIIAWVKGKRGSAWYRPPAIEIFIAKELEQLSIGGEHRLLDDAKHQCGHDRDLQALHAGDHGRGERSQHEARTSTPDGDAEQRDPQRGGDADQCPGHDPEPISGYTLATRPRRTSVAAFV